MNPRLPQRDTQPPSPPENRDAATWLALGFLLLLGGGFVALISLMLPAFIWVVAVLAGMSGMIALHYFTWGRWLLRQNDAPEDESPVRE